MFSAQKVEKMMTGYKVTSVVGSYVLCGVRVFSPGKIKTAFRRHDFRPTLPGAGEYMRHTLTLSQKKGQFKIINKQIKQKYYFGSHIVSHWSPATFRYWLT